MGSCLSKPGAGDAVCDTAGHRDVVSCWSPCMRVGEEGEDVASLAP